ncbi:hypothetical protein GDO81_007107 [Engystomops pustulosus]|uniref:Uncharacterized protein n=1 Tax=Engystomops pustulosus TaxID=76066 RepID=A0AAV7C586_ENGPU|nr:hypothetical protein GDO81_007107 [Engystomops pustulosus]
MTNRLPPPPPDNSGTVSNAETPISDRGVHPPPSPIPALLTPTLHHSQATGATISEAPTASPTASEPPLAPPVSQAYGDEAGQSRGQITQPSSLIAGTSTSGSQEDRLPTVQDIKSLLSSLPTKEDISLFASQILAECRQEFASLRSDVTSLTSRVDDLEQAQSSTAMSLESIQDMIQQHHAQLHALQQHMDDIENRSRRNNLRIKGLPESVQPATLFSTITEILNGILGRPPNTPIEIDRAHRALRPLDLNAQIPRDVVCRIHFYSLKEQILLKLRNQKQVTFQGTSIKILPDLSRYTLAQRAAVRPLLDMLKEHNLPYRWGFPFALHVCSGGKDVTLRSPNDLKPFLQMLRLPAVSLGQWLTYLPPSVSPLFTSSANLTPLGPRRRGPRKRQISEDFGELLWNTGIAELILLFSTSQCNQNLMTTSEMLLSLSAALLCPVTEQLFLLEEIKTIVQSELKSTFCDSGSLQKSTQDEEDVPPHCAAPAPVCRVLW